MHPSRWIQAREWSRAGLVARAKTLKANEVHFWRCRIPCATQLLANIPLSKNEERRASALVFDRDRRLFTLSHRLVRSVVSAYLDVEPSELILATAEDGKPYAPQLPSLEFNLSHAADSAIVAVTWQRSVGVDIELLELPSNFDQLADFCLSDTERAMFAAHCDPGTFLQLWTRKEAVLKACGCGLTFPPKDLVVDFPLEWPQENFVPLTKWNKEWLVADLHVAPSWHGAIAVRGRDAVCIKKFCLGW